MARSARTISLFRPSALAPGRRLIAWIARAFARRRQRNRLTELPDRLLADVGLTSDDVRRESAKPFWRG